MRYAHVIFLDIMIFLIGLYGILAFSAEDNEAKDAAQIYHEWGYAEAEYESSYPVEVKTKKKVNGEYDFGAKKINYTYVYGFTVDGEKYSYSIAGNASENPVGVDKKPIVYAKADPNVCFLGHSIEEAQGQFKPIRYVFTFIWLAILFSVTFFGVKSVRTARIRRREELEKRLAQRRQEMM